MNATVRDSSPVWHAYLRLKEDATRAHRADAEERRRVEVDCATVEAAIDQRMILGEPISRALVERAREVLNDGPGATGIARAMMLLHEALGEQREGPAPVRAVLRCPECGRQHIDQCGWATRPHRTHLCDLCGAVWQPAEVPTVGVFSLEGEVP